MRTALAHTSLLLLALAPLAASAAGTEPVRNNRVAVQDVTIQPGESEAWRGSHPVVLVYFTDGSLSMAAGSGKPVAQKVKRGDTVFVEAQSRTVLNLGPSPIHFARIEFLGSGLAETWGNTGLAPNYNVLIENRYTRTYDIRIPAGTNEPQHTHHERVVVCLQGALLRHLLPDGTQEPSNLKDGEIAWRRAATHIGQNLGKTDLWVIAVELK